MNMCCKVAIVIDEIHWNINAFLEVDENKGGQHSY